MDDEHFVPPDLASTPGALRKLTTPPQQAPSPSGSSSVSPSMLPALGLQTQVEVTESANDDEATKALDEELAAQAKCLKCDVCNKKFCTDSEVEFHCVNIGHQSFSESSEEFKPLSEEERKEKIKELQTIIKQCWAEREEQEKKEAFEKEIRKTGQDIKMQEQEMKELAEAKRREKLEARQNVLEQIERDKQYIRKQFNMPIPNPPATSPSESLEAIVTPVTPPTESYDQTRIQVRLMNGECLTHTFSSSKELSAARLFVAINCTDGSTPLRLMTNFPKKVFAEEYMNLPLRKLGQQPCTNNDQRLNTILPHSSETSSSGRNTVTDIFPPLPIEFSPVGTSNSAQYPPYRTPYGDHERTHSLHEKGVPSEKSLDELFPAWIIESAHEVETGHKNTNFKKRSDESTSFKSIECILKSLNDRKNISRAKLNSCIIALTDLLLNPKFAPNFSFLVFHVIEYLQASSKNHILSFRDDGQDCVILPQSEVVIVSAIFQVECKYQDSEKNIIKNLLINIYHAIIALKNSNADGQSSLCRVYTAICLRKGYDLKVLSLCTKIIITKLHFAPYLIASVVGVWKNLFIKPQATDLPEEVLLLLKVIAIGSRRKTKKIDDSRWYSSLDLLTSCFGFPIFTMDANLLKNKIISCCTEDLYDKSWMVTSSFVILAAHQPWEWTKKHLIDEYIIPNLSRFAKEEPNEKAFALFSDLCADVYMSSRNTPYEVLMKYYKQSPNEGNLFVKECAACAMLKHLILKRLPIEGSLAVWIESNPSKLNEGQFAELYKRRNIYYSKGLKKSEDVIF